MAQTKPGAKVAVPQTAPQEPVQPETLPAFPVARKMVELDNLDPENLDGFFTCHLPEDVLVDLVSERLQVAQKVSANLIL